MIRQLKTDLQYAWSRKILLWMFLLFIAASVLVFFLNIQNVKMNVQKYQHSMEFSQVVGEQIEEKNEEGYRVLENGIIENPVAYYNEKLSGSIYSMSSQYALSQYCESSLVFFPILAAFFGLTWVSADLKHKTIRHRVLRAGKKNSLLCKQISGFIVLLSVFALTIPFVFIIQSVFRNSFLQSTSLNVNDYHYTSTITVVYWKQIIFAIAILLFYYEFGYTFGNLLKGNPISIVVVCVYVLFIPPLFAYDIANIFNNLAREIFEFVGTFTLNEVIEVSIFNGVLELAGLFIAMIICNIIISNTRSAYA